MAEGYTVRHFEPRKPEDDDEPFFRHEERGNGRKPKASFARINTEKIMATKFEPLRWIVPGFVPEGLTVLAGRMKLGKSRLAMDWALSVACGGFAMESIECEQGNVLYIDLENGQRRIQDRIRKSFPNEQTRPDLSSLDWVTQAPMFGEGFLEALDEWVRSVPKPRFVIIDVLQRVKPAGQAGRNSYENDYSIWAPLQAWALENRIAVLGLHHTRKDGNSEDPIEKMSGSNGLASVADMAMVLDGNDAAKTIYTRGREAAPQEIAIRDTGDRMLIMGEASDVRRSSERGNILRVLEEATEPMSPQELSDVTGMKSGNVRKLLFMMVKAGEAQKTARGRYIHPKNQHLNPQHHTPGNNGNNGNNDDEDGDDGG